MHHSNAILCPTKLRWSIIVSTSRREKFDLASIMSNASKSTSNFSCIASFCNQLTILASLIVFVKRYFWHLERTVRGILSELVVMNMKMKCLGGSCRLFKSAIHVSDSDMWHSSMMNILKHEKDRSKPHFFKFWPSLYYCYL